jgi:hypothetical protein
VTAVRLRLRISLVFVIFEGGMPLTGLGLGSALARGTGQAASYLAGAAVFTHRGLDTAAGRQRRGGGGGEEEEGQPPRATSAGLAAGRWLRTKRPISRILSTARSGMIGSRLNRQSRAKDQHAPGSARTWPPNAAERAAADAQAARAIAECDLHPRTDASHGWGAAGIHALRHGRRRRRSPRCCPQLLIRRQ